MGRSKGDHGTAAAEPSPGLALNVVIMKVEIQQPFLTVNKLLSPAQLPVER